MRNFILLGVYIIDTHQIFLYLFAYTLYLSSILRPYANTCYTLSCNPSVNKDPSVYKCVYFSMLPVTWLQVIDPVTLLQVKHLLCM